MVRAQFAPAPSFTKNGQQTRGPLEWLLQMQQFWVRFLFHSALLAVNAPFERFPHGGCCRVSPALCTASGPAGVAPQSFQMMSSPPGASPSAPLPNGLHHPVFKPPTCNPSKGFSLNDQRHSPFPVFSILFRGILLKYGDKVSAKELGTHIFNHAIRMVFDIFVYSEIMRTGKPLLIKTGWLRIWLN